MSRWLRSLVVQFLVIALLGSTSPSASAAPRMPDPDHMKKVLTKHGIGSKVKVKELDGTQVSGVLTALRDNDFDLTPNGAVQPTSIAYTQVTKVQDGRNLEDAADKSISHAKKDVLIGLGIAGLVAIIFVVAKN
jgi:hypothetical protein